MTDFGHIGISEAQMGLLDVAQRFCRDNSLMEKTRALIEDPLGYDADVWQQIGALGWLGIAIPQSYGGAGLSLTEIVPVAEQMGRYMMHSPFTATSLAAQTVLMGGTEAQKREVLPDIAAGAAATLALSEANGDWDLDVIEAEATLQKDSYILLGVKTFVADLPGAKWVIVSVKMDGAACLAILLRANIPDAAYRREGLIDETRRSYELTLDGLTLEADMLMDKVKRGRRSNISIWRQTCSGLRK